MTQTLYHESRFAAPLTGADAVIVLENRAIQTATQKGATCALETMQLLQTLSDAFGVSGFEDGARAAILECVTPVVDNVRVDTLGRDRHPRWRWADADARRADG